MPPFWPCFLLKNAKLPQCTGMILRAASEITAPSSFSTGMDLSTFKKNDGKLGPTRCLLFARHPTVDDSEIRKKSVDMVNIPLFAGFSTSQVVQDFFHQQYHPQISWNIPLSAWNSRTTLSTTVPTLCQVKLLLHQDMHSKQSSLKPKRQWPLPTFLALDAPTVAGSGFLSETMKGYDIGFLTAKDENKLSQMYSPMKFHINIQSDDFGIKTPLQEGVKPPKWMVYKGKPY